MDDVLLVLVSAFVGGVIGGIVVYHLKHWESEIDKRKRGVEW